MKKKFIRRLLRLLETILEVTAHMYVTIQKDKVGIQRSNDFPIRNGEARVEVRVRVLERDPED